MAKKVERSFDGDRVGLNLQQLIDRFELLVDLSRRLGIALAESSNHGLHPRPDDVRVHTNTTDPAELEEREDQVVVPRIEVEVGLRDDPARLNEVVIRLLDRPN